MSSPWLNQIFAGSPNFLNTTTETATSSSLAFVQIKAAQAIKRLDNAGFIVKKKTINYSWENPSFVVWDEGVSPSLIVELLSEGTDKEDLGLTESQPGKAPTKWNVYEQILKVPNYVVYDRHKDILRAYRLVQGQYQAIEIKNERIWMPELKVELGLWQGDYQGITRKWLRWVDEHENWIPTPEEKVTRLAQRLREMGIDPDQL